MRRVIFLPEADADLRSIVRFAARNSPKAGLAFAQSIKSFCNELAMFPHRGADLSPIRAGLRSIAFDKRATVVFRRDEDQVVIVAIYYRGRDVETALAERIDPPQI